MIAPIFNVYVSRIDLSYAAIRAQKLLQRWTGWLKLVTHIPNKGEQLVRYYGYYSNKSRGLRKKTAAGDELVPSLIEAEISTEEFRRNWARLIQKVYHADPLLCP